MSIFKHTAREPGMWRGWLNNGQSVEISWHKRGWEFGAGVHIHGNDNDLGGRMLFIRLWRLTVVLPLGIVPHPWEPMDGPQWSAYGSSEFGLTFHWGLRRWSFDWPWTWTTLAYEKMMPDGSWVTVFDYDAKPYTEAHPYTYVLKSGEVQNRTATISKRRHVMTRRAFKRMGWPLRIKESIDVKFSDEVGERSGSWEGGCTGCAYDLRQDETMGAALRRMEAERKF